MLFLSALLIASPSEGEMKMPQWVNESIICAKGLCEKKPMKYEKIADVQPGTQWMDAGGYCGSWASQRAFLSIGAWLSQQQVRDATFNCGGHDAEILSCNIAEAWTNLKIDFDWFDYKSSPVPQTKAYFQWLKSHLAAGHVVAWMLMWNGQTYPIYGLTPPEGMYGHVEPVIGIQSNHPLNDSTVYDDDVVVHYTDAGTNTVHRTISTLPCKWAGPGHKANCGLNHYGLGNPYGFGWAAKGFADADDDKRARAVPAYLHVQPWKSEPDTRSGESPEALKGTLTATGLTTGASYVIYRWDSVKSALTYDDEYKKATFTATSDTYVYEDDKSFQSDGATYYRVLGATSMVEA
jgi:hypothetical protein